MNVIRHDYKRVKFVAFEAAFAFGEGMDHHFGDFRLAEEDWTACGVVEQSIHGGEGLAGCQADVRKGTADRKTSMQTECHEHSFANNVKVRKAPIVPAHVDFSGGRELIFSGDFVMVCAGRKPGGRAEALPHCLVGSCLVGGLLGGELLVGSCWWGVAGGEWVRGEGLEESWLEGPRLMGIGWVVDGAGA